MSSASDAPSVSNKEALAEKAKWAWPAALVAARPVLLMTGATTGIVYVVGKAAHEAGISSCWEFHRRMIAANMLIGTNCRSMLCDLIVLHRLWIERAQRGSGAFMRYRFCSSPELWARSMSSTIAHDEGKSSVV